MTDLLERAFKEASKLPKEAQDQLGAQILENLVAESRWEQTLESSAAVLEEFAEKAIEEYRRGETTEQGFDDL